MPRIRSEELRRVMPDVLRYAIYLAFGGIWLTGCWWLLLQQYFASADEFGTVRHSWEPALRMTHGVLGITTAYVFGWVIARHVGEAWRAQRRRISGGLLTLVLATLSVTGFALFFLVEDGPRLLSSRIHDVLGVGVTLAAIEHWRVLRGQDS